MLIASYLPVSRGRWETASAEALPEEDGAALPNWLADSWCSGSGEQRVEEHWLPAAGGLMLGVSRSLVPGRKAQFEFLRIELIEGRPVYLAQPGGRPATAFKQAEAGPDWVTFSNPEHDFPQQIAYRRSGAALTATISGPGPDAKPLRIELRYTACAD